MARIHNDLLVERQRRAMSQAQFAELASISRQSYAAIEAGDAVPSTEVALRLARGLGKSVEALFRLPAREPEGIKARWSGVRAAAVGRRVRVAQVGGSLVALDGGSGERPSREVDGVVRGVEGEEVTVALFDDRPPRPSLVVAGCDPAFGVVVDALRHERGVEAIWVPRSSRAALRSLAVGSAHVAGAHLRDPDGGGFNDVWVSEMVPFACTRIVFALWEQGILVAAGNPMGVADVADLARPGLRLINREVGSGSRALLDEALAGRGVPADSISGYGTAAAGHLAVAEAIWTGLADAGAAIRAAGVAFDLDVIPLAVEPYELIIPNHFLDLMSVTALIETLRRPGVAAQVSALGGYDVSEMGRPR